MDVSGQLHAPAALPPGKDVVAYQSFGGPCHLHLESQSKSWSGGRMPCMLHPLKMERAWSSENAEMLTQHSPEYLKSSTSPWSSETLVSLPYHKPEGHDTNLHHRENPKTRSQTSPCVNGLYRRAQMRRESSVGTRTGR
jgi:hypothetical protein